MGQYRDAVQKCRESQMSSEIGADQQPNFPVLALAYRQLGELDNARASLELAKQSRNRWIEHLYVSDGEKGWGTHKGASANWPLPIALWLEFDTLYREARNELEDHETTDDPRLTVLRARAFAMIRTSRYGRGRVSIGTRSFAQHDGDSYSDGESIATGPIDFCTAPILPPQRKEFCARRRSLTQMMRASGWLSPRLVSKPETPTRIDACARKCSNGSPTLAIRGSRTKSCGPASVSRIVYPTWRSWRLWPQSPPDRIPEQRESKEPCGFGPAGTRMPSARLKMPRIFNRQIPGIGAFGLWPITTSIKRANRGGVSSRRHSGSSRRIDGKHPKSRSPSRAGRI